MALVEQTQFFVFVDGTDVSTNFSSRLISLSITDNSGETSDDCKISLDDTGGHIDLPQQGAHVQVSLGQAGGIVGLVYDGIVDDVTSIYDRGSGMRIEIDAKSADTKGKSKTRRRKHHDKKTVGAALKDAGQYAGVTVEVAPRIANIVREYQTQDNESFLHMAQRYARDYGGTFKVIGGNRAVILDRNAGQTVGGGAVGSVTATPGANGNLISCRLSPILTRPRYGEIITRWFDYKKGKWIEEKVQVPISSGGGSSGGSSGGGGSVSSLGSLYGDGDTRFTREDSGHSKDAATGSGKESDRKKGAGSVIIDGNPRARAEGTCQVIGVRPGIDGSYTIHVAKHDFERGKGYTTDLELRRPEGDAGKNKAQGAGKGAGSGGGTAPGPLYETPTTGQGGVGHA